MSEHTTSSVDRTQPPAPGAASTQPFPGFAALKLRNGLPLYVVENHAQPYVSVHITARGGASHDGSLAGLAELSAGLMTSGTSTHDAQDLADAIDLLGASLDAGAGRDETSVGLGVLTSFLDPALDLLADVTLRPTFPDEEVEREGRQAIAAIQQNMAEPGYPAGVRFRREIYGAGPYGSPVDGTEQTLRAINRDACALFHHQHFNASNTFIVAAGDVTPQGIADALDARLGEWEAGTTPALEFSARRASEGLRVVVVDRPGAVQSALRIGCLAVERGHPDYLPLSVVATVLGGYFNSRINANLRERNGFTYGARAGLESLVMPGTFSVTTSVGTEVTDRAVEETLFELRQIVEQPMPEEELALVQNYITGSQALQTETPGQVASFVQTIALHGLPHDYFQHYPAMIHALDAQHLRNVAERYLRTEGMTVVVAGDARLVAPKLERFGAVEVVEAHEA